MRTIALTALWLLAICQFAVAARPNVELRFGDAPNLSAETQAQLTAKALEIVQTSNFNSAVHTNILKSTTIPAVQAEYRKTISDRYLLVSFDSPKEVKTVGGTIGVQEIVLGLSGSQYAGPLFTIDPQGRVVTHAKYSGTKCVELMEFIRKLTSLK